MRRAGMAVPKEPYVNNLFLLGILVEYFGTISLCRLIDPLNSTQWLPD